MIFEQHFVDAYYVVLFYIIVKVEGVRYNLFLRFEAQMTMLLVSDQISISKGGAEQRRNQRKVRIASWATSDSKECQHLYIGQNHILYIKSRKKIRKQLPKIKRQQSLLSDQKNLSSVTFKFMLRKELTNSQSQYMIEGIMCFNICYVRTQNVVKVQVNLHD